MRERKRNKFFYALISFILAAVITTPTMLINNSEAASKPKVKITTNMDTHDKVYVGTKTTLKIKTSTSSTLTFKTSDSKIATVKNGRLYAYRPGTAKIKIYAKPKSSRYTTGYKYFYVDVLPEKPETPSASRSGSKINVNINKTSGAYGYQYVYATNSKFSGYKRITTRNTSCSFTASSSKNYYVKARAYAKVDGKTYYSGWSKVKKVNAVPSGPKITEIDIWDSKVLYNSVKDRPGQLTCTVRPFGADDYIIWKSSDTKVAKVDSYGRLTLVGEGVCTITASSPDGRVSDSCKVTVGGEKITSIKLNKTSFWAAHKNYSVRLIATATPTNVNVSNHVRWKSSNKNVAVVDQYGLVDLKGKGSCVITAYSKSNPDVKATCDITIDIPNELDPNHPYVKKVAELVNEERAKAGLPALEYDEKVTEAAMIRAKEQEQYYGHERPDGRPCWTALTDVGIDINYAGENCAMGNTTPENVMSAWMNSPGHKANILGMPYRMKFGIGLYQDEDGTNYWVQMFI